MRNRQGEDLASSCRTEMFQGVIYLFRVSQALARKLSS